jgi:hypothetical protein
MNIETENLFSRWHIKTGGTTPLLISLLRPLCNPIAVTPPLRTAAGVLEIITQAVLTLKTSYIGTNDPSLPTPWHTGHIKLSSNWIRLFFL